MFNPYKFPKEERRRVAHADIHSKIFEIEEKIRTCVECLENIKMELNELLDDVQDSEDEGL